MSGSAAYDCRVPNRPEFTVVVCTRNRPDHLAVTLDALAAQDGPPFTVLVVDQSDQEDEALASRERAGAVRVLRGSGLGLSRARNAAWPLVDHDWVVFVDDDCTVEPGWAEALRVALDRHPDAAFLTGHVGERGQPAHGLTVSSFAVDREVTRKGPRVWPFEIGFGVFMVVARAWVERLDGWDERLGAGVPAFPAAEDMDFNSRLLREGGMAVAVPSVRVVHEQWRGPDELPEHFRRYAIGWAGFAMKTLRSGSPLLGVRLWAWGAFGAGKMWLSALRRRSPLRARVALGLTRGHATGTVRGLRRRW